MKKFFSFFKKNPPEKKENPVGAAMVIGGSATPIGGAKEGKALIRDGYQRNVIMYRCINEITTAITSIKFDLYKGKNKVEEHEILKLLRRPNPMQGQAAFLEEAFTNYMLCGEMFFSKAGPDNGPPKELWNMLPLDVKIEPGLFGMPKSYVHEKNGSKTVFPVDAITGKSAVFFHKKYNPDDYWRGQPPIRAAALAADAHNESLQWNYSLMKKSARPSGYIKAPGGYPGPEVVASLREFFMRNYQGSENAGEVPILSGDAEYKPFEASPKDMDWINGTKELAKYVASALGVPLPLVDNDASSYNNMEQAKERLYSDTVLPCVNLFLDTFNSWLAFWFGEGYALKVDEDCIAALEGMRTRKFERTLKAKEANVITINETREEIGKDKYKAQTDDPADKLYMNGGLVPLDMADVGYDPTEADPANPDPKNPDGNPDDEGADDEKPKPKKPPADE